MKAGTEEPVASLSSRSRDQFMASLPEFDTAYLERQVSALGGEVVRLRKSLIERGSELYDDAGDAAANYYADLADMFRSNLPALRRRAISLQRSMYNNPALVGTIGLGVVGLMVSLLLRGRWSTPPSPKGRKRAR
jgi:hypothetical protein